MQREVLPLTVELIRMTGLPVFVSLTFFTNPSSTETRRERGAFLRRADNSRKDRSYCNFGFFLYLFFDSLPSFVLGSGGPELRPLSVKALLVSSFYFFRRSNTYSLSFFQHLNHSASNTLL